MRDGCCFSSLRIPRELICPQVEMVFILQAPFASRVLVSMASPAFGNPNVMFLQLVFTPNASLGETTAQELVTLLVTQGMAPGSALNQQLQAAGGVAVAGVANYTLLDSVNPPTVQVEYRCLYTSTLVLTLDAAVAVASCPSTASSAGTPPGAAGGGAGTPVAIQQLLLNGLVNLPPLWGTNLTIITNIFSQV